MPKPKNIRKSRNRRQRQKAESWRKTERWLEERDEVERARCVTGPVTSRASDDDNPTDATRKDTDDYPERKPRYEYNAEST